MRRENGNRLARRCTQRFVTPSRCATSSAVRTRYASAGGSCAGGVTNKRAVRTPWMADNAACSEATSATSAGICSTGTSEARSGVSRSAKSGGRSPRPPTRVECGVLAALASESACGSDGRTVTLSQSDFECASVAVSRLSADGNDVLRCCAIKLSSTLSLQQNACWRMAEAQLLVEVNAETTEKLGRICCDQPRPI